MNRGNVFGINGKIETELPDRSWCTVCTIGAMGMEGVESKY